MNLNTTIKTIRFIITAAIFSLAVLPAAASAQSTAFSYQGHLNDGASAANGNYDFEFRLFDAVSGGNEIGSVNARSGVAVEDGTFAVTLDFGAEFPGGARYLEIRVRSAGGGGFTTLDPRQKVDSAPYAMRSLNAANAENAQNAVNAQSAVNAETAANAQNAANAVNADTAANALQLGGVAANQYVLTGDARLSDPRVPLPGSGNYIQNTTNPQAASNFNISGNGTLGGVLSMSSGTAVAPSITFSGDTGTGIFRSAANTLDFATNGASRMQIGPTGDVAIGTVKQLLSGGDPVVRLKVHSSTLDSTAISGENTFTGSENATAVSGRSVNAPGFGIGGTFRGGRTGVSGFADATTGTGDGFGVTGGSNGSAGSRYGVYGSTNVFSGTTASYGLYGFASGAAITNYGVFGTALGGTTNWAGWFEGDVNVTGTVSGNGSGLTSLSAGSISTGTLAVARGGTGLTVSGAAGNFLRSSGASWASSAIQTADVPSGSTFYIQNRTTPQASTNFNISGNGTAGATLSASVINANSLYRLGGAPILDASPELQTTIVGLGAGAGNPNIVSPEGDSTGFANSYFGFDAGRNTFEGSANTFIGNSSGVTNTSGFNNSFLGAQSGCQNNGSGNTFLGYLSGCSNTSGFLNVFVGNAAGQINSTGGNNTFIGAGSGPSGASGGSNNTLIGSESQTTVANINNAAAIGYRSSVTCSNCLSLGSVNGVNGATSSTNVGIGTPSPQNRLHVVGAIQSTGPRTTPVGNAVTLSSESTFDALQSWNNRPLVLNSSGNNVGIGTTNPLDKLHVIGNIRLSSLGSANTTTVLCRNTAQQIATCNSSSRRYKFNINDFGAGLDLVRRLRPVMYNWRAGGALDVGLVAEEVAEAEPLLATYNENGQIEGVKYDRVGVVLINAVREQQSMIDAQRKTIANQQAEIDKLKQRTDAMQKALCGLTNDAALCEGVN